MTQQLSILNSKQAKQLRGQLKEQYGYSGALDFVVLKNEKKEKLYLFTKDLVLVDISELRIDTMGLYFAAEFAGQLRLTIEGSQLIGPGCEKRIVELTFSEMQRWMLGEDLDPFETQIQEGTFVIVRHGSDFLGSGKVRAGKLLNYIPKARYVHATFE